MKSKTSELIGPALDWTVAKCEGYPTAFFFSAPKKHFKAQLRGPDGRWDYYHPSTDPSQAWPIIEREDIFFSPLPDKGLRAFQFKDGQYLGLMDCWSYAEPLTRLIVGMRCHVASKLGDEVDVPEELMT